MEIFSFLNGLFLFYVYKCFVWMYVYAPDAYLIIVGGQNRVLDQQGLELQMVVSYRVDTGNGTQVLLKKAPWTPNCETIFLAPKLSSYMTLLDFFSCFRQKMLLLWLHKLHDYEPAASNTGQPICSCETWKHTHCQTQPAAPFYFTVFTVVKVTVVRC